MSDVPSARPLLRVVRGNPTAEELGAVVALLAARSASGDDIEPEERPLWGRPSLRQPLHAGPGAWRASGLR